MTDDPIERVVAEAIRARETRERGYRAQSLKLHPWVCGRCGRGFDQRNLHELTVHHKDHNHDNNPLDGRNWENLRLYCHDNEHWRLVGDTNKGTVNHRTSSNASHRPLADLSHPLKQPRNESNCPQQLIADTGYQARSRLSPEPPMATGALLPSDLQSKVRPS